MKNIYCIKLYVLWFVVSSFTFVVHAWTSSNWWMGQILLSLLLQRFTLLIWVWQWTCFSRMIHFRFHCGGISAINCELIDGSETCNGTFPCNTRKSGRTWQKAPRNASNYFNTRETLWQCVEKNRGRWTLIRQGLSSSNNTWDMIIMTHRLARGGGVTNNVQIETAS